MSEKYCYLDVLAHGSLPYGGTCLLVLCPVEFFCHTEVPCHMENAHLQGEE